MDAKKLINDMAFKKISSNMDFRQAYLSRLALKVAEDYPSSVAPTVPQQQQQSPPPVQIQNQPKVAPAVNPQVSPQSQSPRTDVPEIDTDSPEYMTQWIKRNAVEIDSPEEPEAPVDFFAENPDEGKVYSFKKDIEPFPDSWYRDTGVSRVFGSLVMRILGEEKAMAWYSDVFLPIVKGVVRPKANYDAPLPETGGPEVDKFNNKTDAFKAETYFFILNPEYLEQPEIDALMKAGFVDKNDTAKLDLRSAKRDGARKDLAVATLFPFADSLLVRLGKLIEQGVDKAIAYKESMDRKGEYGGQNTPENDEGGSFVAGENQAVEPVQVEVLTKEQEAELAERNVNFQRDNVGRRLKRIGQIHDFVMNAFKNESKLVFDTLTADSSKHPTEKDLSDYMHHELMDMYWKAANISVGTTLEKNQELKHRQLADKGLDFGWGGEGRAKTGLTKDGGIYFQGDNGILSKVIKNAIERKEKIESIYFGHKDEIDPSKDIPPVHDEVEIAKRLGMNNPSEAELDELHDEVRQCFFFNYYKPGGRKKENKITGEIEDSGLVFNRPSDYLKHKCRTASTLKQFIQAKWNSVIPYLFSKDKQSSSDLRVYQRWPVDARNAYASMFPINAEIHPGEPDETTGVRKAPYQEPKFIIDENGVKHYNKRYNKKGKIVSTKDANQGWARWTPREPGDNDKGMSNTEAIMHWLGEPLDENNPAHQDIVQTRAKVLRHKSKDYGSRVPKVRKGRGKNKPKIINEAKSYYKKINYAIKQAYDLKSKMNKIAGSSTHSVDNLLESLILKRRGMFKVFQRMLNNA